MEQVIFIFIVCLVGILGVTAILLNKKEPKDIYKGYKLCWRVLNDSEQAFYINLQKVLGAEYTIFAKVRIEDFIMVSKSILPYEEWFGARGRIKSRHIDFLICSQANTKPLLAIELDGYSHNWFGRPQRDRFVEGLYAAVGLKLARIPVGTDFASEAVKIKELLAPSPSATIKL